MGEHRPPAPVRHLGPRTHEECRPTALRHRRTRSRPAPDRCVCPSKASTPHGGTLYRVLVTISAGTDGLKAWDSSAKGTGS
jgi:hypothetical protein